MIDALDSWIITPRAARLFLISVLLVLALIPVFMGRVDTTKMSFWTRLPWGILGIFGPAALFFLYLGMWWYWVRIDNSAKIGKQVWFVVLLFGAVYGSVLYYFCVYWQQTTRRSRSEI